MKRSKRKSGSASSRKRSPQRQAYFPSDEAWNNIIGDCQLTSKQREALDFTLREALNELDRLNIKLKKQQSRAVLIDRLMTFEKAIHDLLRECRCNIDLMHSFLPHNALAYIGRSLTFSAISEALGRDVSPKSLDNKIRIKQSRGERITFASMDDLSSARRETLGLEFGHLILTHFVETIHASFSPWIEASRLHEGGRPADAARKHLIYRLAEAAPEIIGRPATVAVTGTFVDLCTAVLTACGLPETGIAKAVPAVVKKLRADQAKWRRGRAE
jgi:hypothetical protein